MLALLVFVGVTLLDHKDADFFAFGASTQLPLVGVSVPPEAFFWTAPILTAALYVYLHLYLINLWVELGRAPAHINGRPLIDRVTPSLIVAAALWYRDLRRSDSCSGVRPFRIASTLIGFLLIWVFGWVVLITLWVRSMPAHLELMTLMIGACLTAALAFGWISLIAAERLLRRRDVARLSGFNPRLAGLGFALVAGIISVSWATTEGGGFGEDWLYPADLAEAELTVRSADWKDRETWMEDYEVVWKDIHLGAFGSSAVERENFLEAASKR
ncbi:MAG: hypothetical protein AAGE80_13120 [Pseudomonadota bacterium]